jgi:uncharacterized membrane protein YiaA
VNWNSNADDTPPITWGSSQSQIRARLAKQEHRARVWRVIIKVIIVAIALLCIGISVLAVLQAGNP